MGDSLNASASGNGGPSTSISSRILSFKNRGLTEGEMRRRREDESIQLRKQRRNQQLIKRRHILDSTNADIDLEKNNLLIASSGPSTSTAIDPDIASEIVVKLFSGDPRFQYDAVKSLRVFLCRYEHESIENVCSAEGMVNRVVELLSNACFPELQFECCWTKQLVDAGVIPLLIDIAKQHNHVAAEQALWALGNITGDSSTFRDECIRCGLVDVLVDLDPLPKSTRILRTFVWNICNLCRGKDPPPDQKQIEKLLPIIVRHLMSDDDCDEVILRDAILAVSYLSDGSNERIANIIRMDITPLLCNSMMSSNHEISLAALRAVGNIVSGDQSQTQVAIDAGAIPIFVSLLHSPLDSIRKEAAWSLSNVLAGGAEQIQYVIVANGITKLIDLLMRGDFKTRTEAAWGLTNAVCSGSKEQVVFLVASGLLPPLCDMLTVLEPKIVLTVLSALERVLHVGSTLIANKDEMNPYALLIESYHGLEKLEFLQTSDNVDICVKAFDLLDQYFANADEHEHFRLAMETDNINNPMLNNNAITFDAAVGDGVDFDFT